MTSASPEAQTAQQTVVKVYLASSRQQQAARDAPGAGSRDYHGNSANLCERSRALILTWVNTLQKGPRRLEKHRDLFWKT